MAYPWTLERNNGEGGTEYEYSMLDPYATLDHALYNPEELIVETIESTLGVLSAWWVVGGKPGWALEDAEGALKGAQRHYAAIQAGDSQAEFRTEYLEDLYQFVSNLRHVSIDADGENGMTTITISDLWKEVTE